MKPHEITAQKLADRFNNQDGYPFYCKVALKLTESRIWQLVEIAELKDTPARYFSTAAKREM